MIRLDAATVLLQWATGGMMFGWVTTRTREVGLGYGWMLRITFGLLALLAAIVGFRYGLVWGRELGSAGVVVACTAGLTVSVRRRRAGVRGQRAAHDQRSARVAAMTGIDRSVREVDEVEGPEFPPAYDLAAAIIGFVGLIFAAGAAAPNGGWDLFLSLLRTIVGALFLGAITDAMLLGHWYLVQPGLPRRLLNELVDDLVWIWPFEVIGLLLPTGMLSVWTGAVNDGWNGMLGWFWGACAVATIVLIFVTKAALKEREYSAVMAATGLLYLAILTAFGTDLVARAVLER